MSPSEPSTPALDRHAGFEAHAYRALARLAASPQRDPATLTRLTVDAVRDLLEADAAVLRWWDAEADGLLLLASNDRGELPAAPVIGAGAGTIGLAFTRGRPVLVEDYAAQPNRFPERTAAGVRSAIAAPMVVGERVVGAVAAVHYSPRTFSDEQLELLSLVAAQVAPTIESARLVEERDRQAQAFRALYEVGVAASGQMAVAELAQLAVERARQLVGGHVGLSWWDPGRDRLVRLAGNDAGWTSNHEMRIGQGAVGSAFESGATVRVDDYRAWAGADATALTRGLRSIAAVPLLVGSRAVGVLAVRNYELTRVTDEQIEVLSLLASVVAPAIESARLFQESREQARVFGALHEIAVAAGGVLDAGTLARLVVDRTRDLLDPALGVTIYWLQGEPAALRRLASNDPGAHLDTDVVPGQGTIGTAFRDRRPVLIADYPS